MLDEEKCTFIANRINTEICNLIGENRETIPELYHYTTAKGLVGIVESGSFWATKIEYFDDPNEILYGIALCKTILEEMQHENNDYILALKVFIDIYKEDYINNLDNISNLYAISFCEESEILGQWRQYGSKGNGYCLGMNIDKSMNIGPFYKDVTNEEYFHAYKPPLPIIYDIDEQRNLICSAIIRIGEIIKEELTKESISDKSDEAFKYYTSIVKMIITSILPYIKKPEFNNEREWRVICRYNSNDSDVCFRSDGNNIIPFIRAGFYQVENGETEHKLPPINKIIIGQANNYYKNLYSIKCLLRKENYENVQIIRSIIEFV